MMLAKLPPPRPALILKASGEWLANIRCLHARVGNRLDRVEHKKALAHIQAGVGRLEPVLGGERAAHLLDVVGLHHLDTREKLRPLLLASLGAMDDDAVGEREILEAVRHRAQGALGLRTILRLMKANG
jgi:hypothetical protein